MFPVEDLELWFRFLQVKVLMCDIHLSVLCVRIQCTCVLYMYVVCNVHVCCMWHTMYMCVVCGIQCTCVCVCVLYMSTCICVHDGMVVSTHMHIPCAQH